MKSISPGDASRVTAATVERTTFLYHPASIDAWTLCTTTSHRCAECSYGAKMNTFISFRDSAILARRMLNTACSGVAIACQRRRVPGSGVEWLRRMQGSSIRRAAKGSAERLFNAAISPHRTLVSLHLLAWPPHPPSPRSPSSSALVRISRACRLRSDLLSDRDLPRSIHRVVCLPPRYRLYTCRFASSRVPLC